MIDNYMIEKLREEWYIGPFYYPDYTNQPEYKEYYWNQNFGEIHFKNELQKAIWILIQGQLSDGYWENRNVDWSFWFKLKPIVDDTIGWKVYDDYIPTGEWPIDIFELNDILVDIEDSIKHHFNLENYDKDSFYRDLEVVMKSMGTSLRKIGYLN